MLLLFQEVHISHENREVLWWLQCDVVDFCLAVLVINQKALSDVVDHVLEFHGQLFEGYIVLAEHLGGVLIPAEYKVEVFLALLLLKCKSYLEARQDAEFPDDVLSLSLWDDPVIDELV